MVNTKAEVSPLVAAIVIILVIAIAFSLAWYFLIRQPAPPQGIGGGPPMPGMPIGAPPMPGAPPAGAPMPPPAPGQ